MAENPQMIVNAAAILNVAADASGNQHQQGQQNRVQMSVAEIESRKRIVRKAIAEAKMREILFPFLFKYAIFYCCYFFWRMVHAPGLGAPAPNKLTYLNALVIALLVGFFSRLEVKRLNHKELNEVAQEVGEVVPFPDGQSRV